MADLFDNIINESFKKLHERMMDSLLGDSSCTVPCRLNYRATKFEDCNNCIYDPIGGKSSNRFQNGGPAPFYHGVCPICNGVGKIQVSTSETLNLMPIWDSKDWFPLKQSQVNMADISVQTLSKIGTYPKLVRATSIQIDTNVEKFGIPEFTRVGHPEICGLGQSTHIITSWTRQ